MEREWLLLGEPASPRNTIILDDEQDTSTLTITPTGPGNASNQDVEALQSPNSNDLIESSSDTDSSTDIDAVVDEYRQKVEVTTSGPSEKILRIPSMESWRLSIVLIVLYFFGVSICLLAFGIGSVIVFSAGALGKFSPEKDFYIFLFLIGLKKQAKQSPVQLIFKKQKMSWLN